MLQSYTLISQMIDYDSAPLKNGTLNLSKNVRNKYYIIAIWIVKDHRINIVVVTVTFQLVLVYLDLIQFSFVVRNVEIFCSGLNKLNPQFSVILKTPLRCCYTKHK